MTRDFGAGLSVDELIGMSAWHIHHLDLPPGDSFKTANRAASILIGFNLESSILQELWSDGHTVWYCNRENSPVVVTPTGQLIRTQT